MCRLSWFSTHPYFFSSSYVLYIVLAGIPAAKRSRCVRFISISIFPPCRVLVWYFPSRVTLPSYLMFNIQFTLMDLFSAFDRRLPQIFFHRTISNIPLILKCGTCKLPWVSAQTAFGRLRYLLSAKRLLRIDVSIDMGEVHPVPLPTPDEGFNPPSTLSTLFETYG